MANDDVRFGVTTYPQVEKQALEDARAVVMLLGSPERKERLDLYFREPAQRQSPALAAELLAGLAEIIKTQHEANAPRPRGRPRKHPIE